MNAQRRALQRMLRNCVGGRGNEGVIGIVVQMVERDGFWNMLKILELSLEHRTLLS